MPEPVCISALHPRAARQLRVALAMTALLLAVGLTAPIVTVKKFVLVENTFSILSGVLQLARDGQWFLFAVITGFSVLVPMLKIALLYRLVSSQGPAGAGLRRHLDWLHTYGKWSMLDVFIVAVLVVAVKLGAIASVEMRYGLYAFAAAVLLTMIVTARVVSLSDAPRPPPGQ